MSFRALSFAWLLMVLTACSQAPTPADGDDNAWLLGTWELTHDPDQNPTDWLVFAADGQLTVKAPDGREFNGRYELHADVVKLAIEVEGKRLGIDLAVSADKARLSNESGAYYTKP